MNNRRGVRWWLGAFLSIAMMTTTNAEVVVIYDNGQTHTIKPLLAPLLRRGQSSIDSADVLTGKPPTTLSFGTVRLSNRLPVQSSALSLGDSAEIQLRPEVLARLAQSNPRPLFLIGSDVASLRWLIDRRDSLRALGAVGILVQADSESDVQRVAKAAQGLPMTLASGDDLAQALGIVHYPVLITRDGIQQ